MADYKKEEAELKEQIKKACRRMPLDEVQELVNAAIIEYVEQEWKPKNKKRSK